MVAGTEFRSPRPRADPADTVAVMAETRWLDADEQRTWRAFLRMSRQLLDRLDHELQADAGIPHAYYEILVVLSESPERSRRMTDLADVLFSSRSRLSHAVDRLETLGWVERSACPTDRRGTVARLTDAGFTALAGASNGHVEGVRTHLFDQLDPDQVHQLAVISGQVLDHLRGGEPTRAPSGE
jgi:DNA-binding MarR family transcriptional regulator